VPPIVEKNGADGVNEEDESLEYVGYSLKNNINNFVMPLWLRAMFYYSLTLCLISLICWYIKIHDNDLILVFLFIIN
jgi:hypothetical protein